MKQIGLPISSFPALGPHLANVRGTTSLPGRPQRHAPLLAIKVCQHGSRPIHRTMMLEVRRREMVKFSSQGRALVSCLPFFGRLVWEVILGLSLAHTSLPSSGPLHSLGSNAWRREYLPLVFLTAFSCLLVQFRSPDLAVAKASPALVWAFGRRVAASLKLLMGQPVPQRTHRTLCI